VKIVPAETRLSPGFAARRINSFLLEAEDGAAAATNHVLARIGRWPFRGKAAGHLVDPEIPAGSRAIVAFGDFREAGMATLRAFQLS
jgi:hypothetical protein